MHIRNVTLVTRWPSSGAIETARGQSAPETKDLCIAAKLLIGLGDKPGAQHEQLSGSRPVIQEPPKSFIPTESLITFVISSSHHVTLKSCVLGVR